MVKRMYQQEGILTEVTEPPIRPVFVEMPISCLPISLAPPTEVKLMSPLPVYDVIIAGAGSIGTPTAFYLARAGLRVLVLEALPSVGQASINTRLAGSAPPTPMHQKYIYAQKPSGSYPPGRRFMAMISNGALADTVLSRMSRRLDKRARICWLTRKVMV